MLNLTKIQSTILEKFDHKNQQKLSIPITTYVFLALLALATNWIWSWLSSGVSMDNLYYVWKIFYWKLLFKSGYHTVDHHTVTSQYIGRQTKQNYELIVIMCSGQVLIHNSLIDFADISLLM